MANKLKEKTPAIVLGCHKIGLGIIRALGDKGIPVVGVYYNKMDMGYVSKFVIASYYCPHPDEDENGFVKYLINLASKWEGSLLIPSDDATLIPISKQKILLEEKYTVCATDWDITEKYVVKKYTYSLADEIGVLAPRTSVIGSLEDAKYLAKDIGYPCLLKPTIGHRFFENFRKKMILIENDKQLENVYKKTEESGAEMMIQEFIPGDDKSGVNYNCYMIDGEAKVEATAEKLRLSPPGTGFPIVAVSKYIPNIIEPGRKILRALGFDGFSCTEFKKDSRDGNYKLMEVNGRHNLSTPLSVKSGVNFPYMTYMHLLYGKIPEVNNNFKEGIYWIDLDRELSEIIRSCFKTPLGPFRIRERRGTWVGFGMASRVFARQSITVREFIKPYLRPHVYSIPFFDDPLPLLKRSLDIIKSIPRFIGEIF